MSNPVAPLRVLDELLWVFRREQFAISTAQAIDALRAVRAVGLDHPRDVREALASIVVVRARDRPRFDAIFEAFFAGRRPEGEAAMFWERLALAGFDDAEREALRDLLASMAGDAGGADLGLLLEGGAELESRIAASGVSRAIDARAGLQLGFQTHRLLRAIGADPARAAVARLRARLVTKLGARGSALADAVAMELDRVEDRMRGLVRHWYDVTASDLERDRRERSIHATPFASLSEPEVEDVRRELRIFAERLRGAARVRERRALRGGIDAHRTLRRALRTGGVPIELPLRRRRRQRSKVILLCDVSDSVRPAARFLLELTYAVQELFVSARSFVFVSDLAETTALFRGHEARVAVDLAWRGAGGLVRTTDNSNYGRALRLFERRHLRELDRRTTVVVLGDGRSNYHDAATDVLDQVRVRSRALVWLCPEPQGLWAQGDSAMAAYAPKCTAVLHVECAADLERAARLLARL